MPELAFVTPPAPPGAQPLRAPTLVDALRDELHLLGVRTQASPGVLPPARPGLVHVLVGPGAATFSEPPPGTLLARSVVVLDLDPPASEVGRAGPPTLATLAPSAGVLLHLDAAPPDGATPRPDAPAPPERLPLGFTERWLAPGGPARDIDVLAGGPRTPRRDALLATYAPTLARRRFRLALDEEPSDALLRRAKVVLCVGPEHPRFDPLLAVRATLAGAVVVAETAPGTDPLVPGEHLICGRAETLGHLAHELLDEEAWRLELHAAALARLRERPLRAAAERLLTLAARLEEAGPAPSHAAWRWRPAPQAPPAPAPVEPDADVRRALKQLRLDAIDSRRRMERLEARLLADAPGSVEVLHRTPALQHARPRVSVLVSLYDYERHIEAALDSVAVSTFKDVEVIVVDDASRDGSADRAARWLEAHPALPALLVRHRWNRGLPHARNTALDFARARACFVLDADNALYPDGLARLTAALDADPEADFAYGVIEAFDGSGPVGLLSVGAWDPARLREANFIDAMALVRTAALRSGGFATDPRLHGLEDYELWCRMAEEGRRGVAVEELVGRYRVAGHAMLRSTTAISSTDAMSVLADRHPRVMAGATPPG